MKKEEKLSPSSSRRRRENSPEKNCNNLQAKSIGCMSSFLKLIYPNNGRRSLTFGRKQEKNVKSCKHKANHDDEQQYSSLKSKEGHELALDINNVNKIRLSCEVPRSPTLPADIRRSNTASSSPVIVARLMGLEEKNDIKNYINVGPADSMADKRRKLLGALEKCDEDLKALKKIIEIVTNTKDSGDGEKEKQEEPNKKRCINYGRVIQQKKKPGEEEEDGKVTNICFGTGSTQAKKCDNIAPRSSTPMAESVDQVCRDIAWGVKREVGRIGLALQDHICRDLIEEIVKEMECYCKVYHNNVPLPPFEACKRRLYF